MDSPCEVGFSLLLFLTWLLLVLKRDALFREPHQMTWKVLIQSCCQEHAAFTTRLVLSEVGWSSHDCDWLLRGDGDFDLTLTLSVEVDDVVPAGQVLEAGH